MKVYPFQIAKPLNENLIVQVDSAEQFYTQLHQHSEIQLSLIVKGHGKLFVGDGIHTFSSGDIFVLGPNSPHLFKTENTVDTVEMVSLFFTDATFGYSFFELPDIEEIRPFFNDAQNGFQLLSHQPAVTELLQELIHLDKLSRFISFLKLLRLVCAGEKRPLTNFLYPKKISDQEGERMQSIFEFAIGNFQNDITLESAARLVHMTPNAFCRFFKKRTNKTFFQFLIELRIEHACQLLRTKTDATIAEIAEQSGFCSISNFNRTFKVQKGVVPSGFLAKANLTGPDLQDVLS